MRELEDGTGDPVDKCIVDSFHNSRPHCWAIKAAEDVVGLFGVGPLLYAGRDETWGAPWMMCSDAFYTIKYQFLHDCNDWVDHMNDLYPNLINFVDDRNPVGIEWLKYQGFTFHEKLAYGPHRLPFWCFTRFKSQICA